MRTLLDLSHIYGYEINKINALNINFWQKAIWQMQIIARSYLRFFTCILENTMKVSKPIFSFTLNNVYRKMVFAVTKFNFIDAFWETFCCPSFTHKSIAYTLILKLTSFMVKTLHIWYKLLFVICKKNYCLALSIKWNIIFCWDFVEMRKLLSNEIVMILFRSE